MNRYPSSVFRFPSPVIRSLPTEHGSRFTGHGLRWTVDGQRSTAYDFAFFGAVPHDHLLRGRTGALVDILRKRGFFIYYFEIPPASILQFFKDPFSHNRGLWNFLFPQPRLTENLIVFPQPPIFPASRFEINWIRKYNRKRIYHRIRHNFSSFLKRRNKPVVAMVSTPWWYEVIEKLRFAFLCYDCIDDLRVFCKEKHLRHFSELQRQLVEKADLVLISAKKLKKDITDLRPDVSIEFLGNGVDFNFFSNRAINAQSPGKLKDLPRPIIGFIGSLFSWIDTELLEATAKAFSNASIVLVGPIQKIKIPNQPNLYYLGPAPYSLIPAYINSFDVCLIPFINDPISEKVDPIKVYEYLSLGKPVVAINLPELERIRSLIYLAKDYESFISSIHQALEENDPQIVKERIGFARANSWDIRVTRLLEIIDNRLPSTVFRQPFSIQRSTVHGHGPRSTPSSVNRPPSNGQ